MWFSSPEDCFATLQFFGVLFHLFIYHLFSLQLLVIVTQSCPWVDPRVGLGWVGLGRGSETFPKILKLVTAEVIPDNLINTDK